MSISPQLAGTALGIEQLQSASWGESSKRKWSSESIRLDGPASTAFPASSTCAASLYEAFPSRWSTSSSLSRFESLRWHTQGADRATGVAESDTPFTAPVGPWVQASRADGLRTADFEC